MLVGGAWRKGIENKKKNYLHKNNLFYLVERIVF
jgi:hypothetical protein